MSQNTTTTIETEAEILFIQAQRRVNARRSPDVEALERLYSSAASDLHQIGRMLGYDVEIKRRRITP